MSYGSQERALTPLGEEDGIYKGWSERYAPYAAEFVGTFLLTTTYLCNLTGDPTWGISSNALMVTALMTALSHISGANLNPSVSISLYLSGRKSFTATLKYCAVQILGAACAGLIVSWKIGTSLIIDVGPRSGFSAGDAMLVEVLFTSMICFVFLNCVASPRNNPTGNLNGFAAIATGFSFIAGGHACKEVSGSVMNPAISVGLQLADINSADPTAWASLFFLMEIVGAFVASGAFRVVRPDELKDPLQLGVQKELAGSAIIMAEFIGTFYVILTKAMVHKRLTLSEPWAVASAQCGMVYSLRGVSGAFFNPAITISVAASTGDMPLHRVAVLIGAQIMGAISATSTFAIISGGADLPVVSAELHSSIGSIALAESLFTFLLCYVVLSTSMPDPPTTSEVPAKTRKQAHNNFAGLAVAGSYLVGGVSVGHVSGSVLNPAVALGYSGLAGLTGDASKTCLPYILYEVAGALAASAAFQVTHAHLREKSNSKAAEVDVAFGVEVA